jgi:hypothetical protein
MKRGWGRSHPSIKIIEKEEEIMTGSWAINEFFIGCIVIMVVPLAVYLYREMTAVKEGDASDI